MYETFYGLTEPPFNLTPNSKYFFESAKHTEALSILLYAIQQRKGFVVISGHVGAGKTTICRALLNRLDSKVKTALITNTYMSAKDMLMTIMDDLEIDYTPGPKSKLHAQLNAYLIEQLRLDNNVVLIIDEAQNLTTQLLEEVRMLSNLETEYEKLVQIVFLGQPELKDNLASPRLEQLRQRIAVYYELTPLEVQDTKEYIEHRMDVASDGQNVYVFTDEAIDEIHRFTKGVPRLVNQICDSALLSGFIYEKDRIDAELVREVIQESPMKMIVSNKKKKDNPDKNQNDQGDEANN